GELCDRTGSYRPFAATRAERIATGDPRPSLVERYGDHAGYVRKVEEAVRRLLSERLLLAEDGEDFITQARSLQTARRFTGAP
ncbi:MAG TPA: alpha/beta hydrolase domain-containing protein, partial [Burkholderiales bacterium]|nr:alpha/beta hydrolase domain-containing protein [Burkholderiales bacterium]